MAWVASGQKLPAGHCAHTMLAPTEQKAETYWPEEHAEHAEHVEAFEAEEYVAPAWHPTHTASCEALHAVRT